MAANKKIYMPSIDAIWACYKRKFSKNGEFEEEQETLGLEVEILESDDSDEEVLIE